MTENEARQMEVEIKWNGRANVCVHCGKVPETYYITTGHDHTDDSIRYCFCRSVAPSIEQLQAKVAELEAENARLNPSPTIEACRQMIRDKAVIEASTLHEQLAAEQLNNKLLRKALKAVIKVHGYESGIPVEALVQPSDTFALDAYVAEKVKDAESRTGNQSPCYTIARDMAVRMWEKHYKTDAPNWEPLDDFMGVLSQISNMLTGLGNVEKITKQRDLAVEALENCRLLAARHRKEEWAGHIMRFCKDAGLSGSPIRNDSIKESENNKAS